MSAYDTILTALEHTGVTVAAKATNARAQCPAHQSTGLTLSIRQGDDRARVNCFAGCDTADVLDALGLALRDLYDDDRAPGYMPIRREPPNPLGDPEHFCDRVLQQERLEADPDWQRRRADELASARRPDDYLGRSVELDQGA